MRTTRAASLLACFSLLVSCAFAKAGDVDAVTHRASETPAAAQDEGKRDVSHWNLDKNKLAIEGYDPVAYFPEGGGKAQKGSDKITVTHKGVVYRFASEANKALFLKSPDRFEPAYGGWCAFAMADGEKVEVDPKSFSITNGKLCLFYKSFFADTRSKWLKKEAELAKKADAAWKAILEKPAPKGDGAAS